MSASDVLRAGTEGWWFLACAAFFVLIFMGAALGRIMSEHEAECPSLEGRGAAAGGVVGLCGLCAVAALLTS